MYLVSLYLVKRHSVLSSQPAALQVTPTYLLSSELAVVRLTKSGRIFPHSVEGHFQTHSLSLLTFSLPESCVFLLGDYTGFDPNSMESKCPIPSHSTRTGGLTVSPLLKSVPYLDLAMGGGTNCVLFQIRTTGPGPVDRISHRKWRETTEQLIWLPDLALLGCSLVSLLFLYDILSTGLLHAHNYGQILFRHPVIYSCLKMSVIHSAPPPPSMSLPACNLDCDQWPVLWVAQYCFPAERCSSVCLSVPFAV